MSDCGVCLYNDFEGPAEVFIERDVRARKPWNCSECRRPIAVSELHQYVKMFFDGEWNEYRTCLVCAEIRGAFSCEGEAFGGFFWDEMEGRGEGDALFEAVTIGCLDRLRSSAAKAYFMQRWQEWKGLVRA